MTSATTIQGLDSLRDPRPQWLRAVNRFATESAAAEAAAGAEPPAPTFAERLRRVEVRGAEATGPSAARPTDPEPPSFAERMRRVPIGRVTDGVALALQDPRTAAREAAEQMVSTMFVQPLLDMALQQEGTGPFAPGQAEKTFGPLLHQAMADEIVRKADLPLVDAMVERTLAAAPPALRPSELKERTDG